MIRAEKDANSLLISWTWSESRRKRKPRKRLGRWESNTSYSPTTSNTKAEYIVSTTSKREGLAVHVNLGATPSIPREKISGKALEKLGVKRIARANWHRIFRPRKISGKWSNGWYFLREGGKVVSRASCGDWYWLETHHTTPSSQNATDEEVTAALWQRTKPHSSDVCYISCI